ncbi:MAG: aldo/keto reductase [Acidobacteria bacterium]|nr:aldo/keto reductase [Acidobacteriota bacterium]
MHPRKFGRLGWPVSEVGYGLWGMGGWTGSDDAESVKALHRSIELGCTFFDTALAYGEGKSERLLGEVLPAHKDTPLVIATKVPPKNGKWPAKPEYDIADVFPPEHVMEATDTSLRNLGVEQIDLQQFHVWTDEWAERDEWMRAIENVKRSGKVKAFGISVNRWHPTNVIEALRTGLVDSVQVVYNIFDQHPEDQLFPLCQEMGVAIIARVPLDEGSLTGTLTKDTTWPDGDFRNMYFPPARLAEAVDRVEELKAEVPRGMTLPEMALRFILSHPAVSTIIPGMRRPQHVETNMAVGDGAGLSTALLERLRPFRWDRGYVVEK